MLTAPNLRSMPLVQQVRFSYNTHSLCRWSVLTLPFLFLFQLMGRLLLGSMSPGKGIEGSLYWVQ
ncbi:hypothetical protein, partial [Klebsiella pneumoniae]|uniref:hypothetical protein n=1 Tax=Klebsiella pneumoniae TaxID=573 RepID=UPI003F52357C